jgi:hypothetical protein
MILEDFMKKVICLIYGLLFAWINSIYASDYNIDDGIFLSEKNQYSSMMMDSKNEKEMISPWDRGKVVRYSNDEKNKTELGCFIEIEYEIGFSFENVFMTQGKVNLILSNLKEIRVNEKMEISKGDIIGIIKGGATKSKKDDLRIFLITNTDNIRILQLWTGNTKTKIDNLWYWDPGFLFS